MDLRSRESREAEKGGSSFVPIDKSSTFLVEFLAEFPVSQIPGAAIKRKSCSFVLLLLGSRGGPRLGIKITIHTPSLLPHSFLHQISRGVIRVRHHGGRDPVIYGDKKDGSFSI